MAASLNKVFLMGNLTRDPEIRQLNSGKTVVKMGLAVNREWRNQQGEQQKETTFLDIEAWGRLAENCGRYLAKGRPVFVEGRLRLDSWETQDGQKRNKVLVVADNVQFLGGRGDGAGGGSRENYAAAHGGSKQAGGDEGQPAPVWAESPIQDRMGVTDDEVPF